MEAWLILNLTLLFTIFSFTITFNERVACCADFIREFWQPVEASWKEFRKISVLKIPANRKT